MGRNPEETWVVTIGEKISRKRMGSSEWARGWNHWDAEGATVVNPNRILLDGLPDGIAWPEWSQDSKYIAFIHDGRLAIADATTIGRPEDWRASNLEPPCDRIEDWSPYGNKLLFLTGMFSQEQVGYVCSINSDGSGVMNLSMSRAKDACWSPDGLQIAFTAADGRKRNTEIFIMNADGTEHVQITNTNYFHTDVDWR